MRPLSNREQAVLDTLYAMHSEFPEAANFEVPAVELLSGPCAGSLGVLAQIGYVYRDVSPTAGGPATCRLTVTGWTAATERRRTARNARATFEQRRARR